MLPAYVIDTKNGFCCVTELHFAWRHSETTFVVFWFLCHWFSHFLLSFFSLVRQIKLLVLDWPPPSAESSCKQIQRRVFCGWICRALATPLTGPPHRPLCPWRWWRRAHRGTPCPQRCCSPKPGGGSWLRSSYQRTKIKKKKMQGHQTADKHFETSRARSDVIPAWFLNHKQETKAWNNSETLMHSV